MRKTVILALVMMMITTTIAATPANAGIVIPTPSTEKEGWECASFDFCLNFEIEVPANTWTMVEYLPLESEIFTIGYVNVTFPFNGIYHFIAYENQTIEYRFGCKNCTRETSIKIQIGVYNMRIDPINGVITPLNRVREHMILWPIIGDLNYDGKVDIGDATYVAQMAAGKVPVDMDADFNENGRVDIGDAAKIAYYVAGKISKL